MLASVTNAANFSKHLIVWRKIAELACIRGNQPNSFARVGHDPDCPTRGGGGGGAGAAGANATSAGSGAGGNGASGQSGAGGGGGLLWANDIQVTPGQSYGVKVGGGGYYAGGDGDSSAFAMTFAS